MLHQICSAMLRHCFLNLSGFFTPRACVCSDCGGGGFGMTPAWPSSRPTVNDGCAPTDSQYLHSKWVRKQNRELMSCQALGNTAAAKCVAIQTHDR